MKGLKWSALLLLGMTLGACVTINIYFPAAAAEKAADKILEDVWQMQKPASQKGAAPTEQPAQQPAQGGEKK